MDISNTIEFNHLCRLLEKVKTGNISNKEKYLRRFYESFQEHRKNYRETSGVNPQAAEDGSSSFFCILRCLIPGADNTRSAYRMQIPTLGKVYIRVLQLIPSSREAQKLEARTYQGFTGDYATVVYSVLSSRAPKEPSKLKLKDIHEMLDKIAADNIRTTEEVLTRLVDIASAREQMWFVRLLLKSMHLGIGEQRIFDILHPKASEIYKRCSSLLNVCKIIADINVSNDQIDLNNAMQPFLHVKPMLCETFPGNLEDLLAADVLYVETKMDGERFQIHYSNGEFKYLSRNGVDYTTSFGENYSMGSLTPLLENLLPVGMQSIILDGEMMVWDAAEQRFREKGENTDVKHLNGYPNCQPCFIAYDLLYFNGKSYLDMPYVKRFFKLREILREEPNVLQTMKPTKVLSAEHFKSIFQIAMDHNDEGIVVKQQNSKYKPGVRNGGGWYKVKADYIDGLTKEFDLLIMGGYYNRTRTFIESFLVGVIEFVTAEQCHIYSVGKVANNSRQRSVLNANLKPLWRDLTNEPPPLWYHYKSTHTEGRPDVWIQPEDSIILEIKATDLVPYGAFVVEKSLHFPRTISWRNDKSWNDCLSLKDYKQIIEGKKGIQKIHKRSLEMDDFASNRTRRKLTVAQKRKLGLAAYKKKFEPNNIECSGDLLLGFSFCILSDSLAQNVTIDSLKELVHRNGGNIVENPLFNDPKCICIAGDVTYRVEQMIKTKRLNIAKMRWLRNACENQYMELKPKDLLYMTDDLKVQFIELYDEYGDSYTKPNELEELKEILDDIPIEALSDISMQAVIEWENVFYKNKKSYFFRTIFASFYNLGNSFEIDFAKIIFEYHLGKYVDPLKQHELISEVNYIFINLEEFDKEDFNAWLSLNFTPYLKCIKIVNKDWIMQSDNNRRIMPIEEYIWHDI